MENGTIGSMKRIFRILALATCLTFLFSVLPGGATMARTAKEINSEANEALKLFAEHIKGGKQLIRTAKAVLVVPNIVKAGLGVGGQYGEGVLRIGGKTVAYYSLAAGSVGLQIGAQKTNLVLIFRHDDALKKFRVSSGWKAGVDGSVAFIQEGTGASLDTMNMKNPVIAFLFGQQGLMASATIEGAKFTRLAR